jgi:hypothetical protein
MWSRTQLVKVRNSCSRAITLYPDKAHPIIVPTGLTSKPLSRMDLIRSRNWASLQTRRCISAIPVVSYTSNFVALTNVSPKRQPVAIKVWRGKPRASKKSVLVLRFRVPRTVRRQSIADYKWIEEQIKKQLIKAVDRYIVRPEPSDPPSSVGSYMGRNVYTCNRCGGPIIFRGSPPKPIHIFGSCQSLTSLMF